MTHPIVPTYRTFTWLFGRPTISPTELKVRYEKYKAENSRSHIASAAAIVLFMTITFTVGGIILGELVADNILNIEESNHSINDGGGEVDTNTGNLQDTPEEKPLSKMAIAVSAALIGAWLAITMFSYIMRKTKFVSELGLEMMLRPAFSIRKGNRASVNTNQT